MENDSGGGTDTGRLHTAEMMFSERNELFHKEQGE